MKRHRAGVAGGYKRSTVTIPKKLYKRAEAQLRKTVLSLSALMSTALEEHLDRLERKKGT